VKGPREGEGECAAKRDGALGAAITKESIYRNSGDPWVPPKIAGSPFTHQPIPARDIFRDFSDLFNVELAYEAKPSSKRPVERSQQI